MVDYIMWSLFGAVYVAIVASPTPQECGFIHQDLHDQAENAVVQSIFGLSEHVGSRRKRVCIPSVEASGPESATKRWNRGAGLIAEDFARGDVGSDVWVVVRLDRVLCSLSTRDAWEIWEDLPSRGSASDEFCLSVSSRDYAPACVCPCDALSSSCCPATMITMCSATPSAQLLSNSMVISSSTSKFQSIAGVLGEFGGF
jgi:hypothetical protein